VIYTVVAAVHVVTDMTMGFILANTDEYIQYTHETFLIHPVVDSTKGVNLRCGQSLGGAGRQYMLTTSEEMGFHVGFEETQTLE